MKHAPFTVKHITDGRITLWAASSVMAIPNGPHDFLSVEFDLGDGSDVRGSIDCGMVYVLNQNGKTVDAFQLAAA